MTHSFRPQRWLAMSVYLSRMDARALIFYLLASPLLFGCNKTEQFPPEPIIKFKEFRTEGSGAVLVFSFTDGDGDIGLDAGDTLAPFNKESTFYHNLWCDYYEFQNNEWVLIELAPELAFNYRIPRVTPTGQNPQLDGELELAMPFYYDPFSPHQQFEFRFRMADRSLNISNEERTGTLTKP